MLTGLFMLNGIIVARLPRSWDNNVGMCSEEPGTKNDCAGEGQ
jgi:hypothetical protein